MRCMSASCVSATHQCGRKVDSGDEEDSQAETEANLDLASRWPIEPALSARHAPPRPAAAPTWPQLGSSCNITTTIDYRAHSNWTVRRAGSHEYLSGGQSAMYTCTDAVPTHPTEGATFLRR